MAVHVRDGVSSLTRLPPRTVGTLALALVGLPLFVLALDVLGRDVPLAVTIAVQWALAGVVVGLAVLGEGLSLPEIGFRRPAWIDAGYLLATAVAILAVYIVTDPLVTALGLPVQSDASAMDAGTGLGLLLASAVTTGVVEEILYRGYPIERLLAYTDSAVVAGGVTWVLFTVAHAVNWPLGNLLQTAVVAAVLTAVYLRRRTLVPVAGAHVLVWVVGMLGQAYG